MEDKTGPNRQRCLDVERSGADFRLDYRLISAYRYLDPANTSEEAPVFVQFRRLIPHSSGQPCQCPLPKEQRCRDEDSVLAVEAGKFTAPAQKLSEDPWVWRSGAVCEMSGRGCIEVAMLAGGKTLVNDTLPIEARTTAPPKKSQRKKGRVYAYRRASRLVCCLNNTPTGTPGLDVGDSPTPDQVGAILRTIWRRLVRGLDGAWRGKDAGRGLGLDQLGLQAPELLEERWARGITEILLGVLYYSPGELYGFIKNKASDDARVFRNFEQNRGYALAAMCQQLCTMGVLSRGFPLDTMNKIGIGAGDDTKGLPLFQGRWRSEDSSRKPRTALQGDTPLLPGSVFLYCKPGTNNVPPAHVGFVLRIHRRGEKADHGWDGFQLFDTGGMNHPLRKNGVRNDFGAANYDDPWVVDTDPLPGPAEYRGVGVLPDAPNLQDAVDKLATAWPLGFARLVLRKRASPKDIIYATPLLRMYTAAESFSIARYLWSLRELPGADNVQAVWEISAPKNGFAEAMMTQGRAGTLPELMTQANMAVVNTPEQSIVDSHNSFHLWRPVTDLMVTAEGQVRCHHRLNDPRSETLPWGRPTGIEVPLDAELAYFAGDAQ